METTLLLRKKGNDTQYLSRIAPDESLFHKNTVFSKQNAHIRGS